MGRNSKLLLAELKRLMDGVQKHFAGQTLVIAGTPITAADLIAKLASYQPRLRESEAAYAAWLATSRALAEFASQELDPLVVDLHLFLQGSFGRDNPSLADFGMTPRRPRKKTTKQKVAIAQKAAATRSARHTVGPRRKQAIRGVRSTK